MSAPSSVTGGGAFFLFLLVFFCASCTGNQALEPEISLNARLVQEPGGRIVVYGEASVPDGTWIYVEVIGDPERLQAVFGEAFPVISRAFAAPTPFSKPFLYRATVVLSPLLNPTLAPALAKLPELPGVVMRPVGGSKELIVLSEDAFGSEEERISAAKKVLGECRRWHRQLADQLALLSGEGWKEDPGRLFRPRDGYESVQVYAAKLADSLLRTQEKIDALSRKRLKGLGSAPPEEGVISGMVEKIQRALDGIDKKIEKLEAHG